MGSLFAEIKSLSLTVMSAWILDAGLNRLD